MHKISLDGRKDVPPPCTNSMRAGHNHTIHIPCPSDRPWFLLLLLEKADLAVLSCACQAPGVTHLRSQGVTVHLHRHPSTSLELCFSIPQKGSQKPYAAWKHSLLRIKPKHLLALVHFLYKIPSIIFFGYSTFCCFLVWNVWSWLWDVYHFTDVWVLFSHRYTQQ